MEIGDRYIEQVQTTVETMRRRCLAYYDHAMRGVFMIGTAYDRLREVAEPAFYDARDYTQTAAQVQDGVDKLEKEEKNSVVELYLGISVLAIGLSCGELAGAYVLPSILEAIFNPYMELLLILILPIHTFFASKKTAAMDDVERRVLLFGLAMSEGALVAHLMGGRLLSLVPSAFFIQPLVFALIIDNELIHTPFVNDRYVLFGASGVISATIATLASTVPLGHISFAVLLTAVAHAAFCALHFQVVTATMRDKIFSIGDSQLAYISLLFVAQIVFAALLGSSPAPVQGNGR